MRKSIRMTTKILKNFSLLNHCVIHIRRFISKCEPGSDLLSQEIVKAINEQIVDEMNASFSYLALSCYFGRLNIALPGCSGFFEKMFQEEQQHANRFIKYLLMRGGNVTLLPIKVPDKQEWDGVDKAFQYAFDMEKNIKKNLEKVYCVAEKVRDLQTMDFIGSKFIEEQNQSIGEMGRLSTRANKMVKDKTGEYLFDKEIFEVFVKGKSDTYK